MNYNGTTYYYILNQQGDVLYIVDRSGNIQTEYVYNAWGEILEVKGTAQIGSVNPLRYRGYYYDAETGFYYVSNRYYDSKISRFINSDSTDILDIKNDLYDKNLFSYCDNNPIMRTDSNGDYWTIIAGAAVGALSQYVSNAIGGLLDGESLKNIFLPTKGEIAEIAGAALSGALTATGIPAGGLAMANATINSASYVAKCKLDKVKIDTTELVASVGRGFISDVTGDGGINGKRLKEVWKTSNKKIKATKSPRKKAMYKAKKRKIKKDVGKNIGVSFASTVVFNNIGKLFKHIFKIK